MRLHATLFCALSTLALAPAPLAAKPAAAPAIARAEIRLPHISVVEKGSGSPIVLLPGLATPRAVWERFVPELARTRRVLLVQVNGFGGDDPGANLQPKLLDGIVEDLHAYLAKRKSGPVKLVGHSMGGLVGLQFAQAHPDQLQSLMVVDSLPFFSVLVDPAATPDSVRPIADAMRAKVASTYGKPADPKTAEANVKGLAVKPASIAQMKAWALAADPRVTGEAMFEDMTTDLRPALKSIRVPVTLVYPWSEQAFGAERTSAFYRAQYAGLPNITYVPVGDAGHFVMLDQPERFAEALRAFAQ